MHANLDSLLTSYSNESLSYRSTSVAECCLFPIPDVAVSEVGTKIAGGAACTANDSALPPVIGVSGLVNMVIGIPILKPAKLGANTSGS